MEPVLLTLVLALGAAAQEVGARAEAASRPTEGWFTLHHDAMRTGRTEWSPGAPFEHVWHNEHWDELIAPEAEPIVAEGLVFYGTFRGFLRGVEADTGKEAWKVDLGLPIRHAPAYDGGRVYAATLGRGGAVVALEARTGKEVWRYRPARPGGFAASPAVDGGAVFIGDRAGDLHAHRRRLGPTAVDGEPGGHDPPDGVDPRRAGGRRGGGPGAAALRCRDGQCGPTRTWHPKSAASSASTPARGSTASPRRRTSPSSPGTTGTGGGSRG